MVLTFTRLDEAYNKLKHMKKEKCPVDYIPYTNRDPVWIEPILVAEVKFSEWTHEKIMRAPIFLRFREDKKPEECVFRTRKDTEELISESDNDGNEKENETNQQLQEELQSSTDYEASAIPSFSNNHNTTAQLSSYSNFSHIDKVFWDKGKNRPQLTKKDLIQYYDEISEQLLPYLKDRPLSLSRYSGRNKREAFLSQELG